MKNVFKTNKRLKQILIPTSALVLLLAGSFYYVYGLGGNIFGWTANQGDDASQLSDTNVGNNEYVNEGTPPQSSDQGGATDKQGKGSVSTRAEDWAVSTTGNITLKSPVAGSEISNGSSVIGQVEPGIKSIGFRLVDDAAGVIAQGNLSVVNSAFSGTLNFRPVSKKATLEVFNVNDATGSEENNVEVVLTLGEE